MPTVDKVDEATPYIELLLKREIRSVSRGMCPIAESIMIDTVI